MGSQVSDTFGFVPIENFSIQIPANIDLSETNLLAPNLEARVLRKRDFGEVSARFRRGLSDENILRKLNVN